MSVLPLVKFWFGGPLIILGLLFFLPRNYNFSTDVILTSSARKNSNTTLYQHKSSCIDDISLLSHHIHSDIEIFGLQRWASNSADADGSRVINFLGLEEDLIKSSFRGKRIFFFGDSTMANLNYWLHNILTMSVASSSRNISSLSTLKLSDAIQMIENQTGCISDPNRNGAFSCNRSRSHTVEPTTLADGTANKYMWAAAEVGDCRGNFEEAYKKMKVHKPDIIVANIGLWWLHFQKKGRNRLGCIAKHWMEYEHWLKQTLDAAESAGANALLFKTTNRICDEKFVHRFAKGTRLYTKKKNETINACVDSIVKSQLSSIPMEDGEMIFCKDTNTSSAFNTANECFEAKGLISRKKDITNYCENGTMNNHGSTQLNQRLVKFVEVNRHNTSLALHVFDDNIIKSCNYTRVADGRHFHPLNPVRIRLLGHLISCIDINKNMQ